MNHSQVRELIQVTLNDLGAKYAKPEAVDMVFMTGYVESRYDYIKQVGTGPAKSFWQVEPDTAVSQCENYIKYRKSLLARCAFATSTNKSDWSSPDKDRWDKILHGNIQAGIVHCRLKYWRVPLPMPKDVAGASILWKRYYNTSRGAGTAKKFIDMVSELT